MALLKELECSPAQLRAIYHYLFRGLTNVEFRSYFEDGRAAKERVDKSGYALLNCKVFAWAAYTAKRRGQRIRASAFDVEPEDAKLLRHLDLHYVGNYRAWSLPEFRAEVEAQLLNREMDEYIGKFISKKLLFLIRSYGLTRDGIVNDLRAAALYSIYRMYPYYKSPLHIRNIGKMALKHKGMDLIRVNTRASKNVLRRLPDGTFESLNVPLTAVTLLPHHNDAEFSVERYLRKLGSVYNKCSPRAQRFLDLLSGKHDVQFSLFLGQNNEELSEILSFEEYCAAVQAHLRISDGQRQRFFQKLRENSK